MIKSLYKKKQTLKPLKSRPTERSPTKQEVEEMALKVLETEQKRGEVDTDLEILNLINEKDQTRFQSSRDQTKELKKHLELIEKRISMLSKEQRYKFSELSKATHMAKKAFQMKILKNYDRKKKFDFLVSQNKKRKKMRKKAFSFREENRTKMINARRKLVRTKREKAYLQNLRYDKMMKKRKKIERAKMNSIRLKKLKSQLKREKSLLKNNNRKKKKRVQKNKKMWNSKIKEENRCKKIKNKLLKKLRVLENIEQDISEVNNATKQYHLMYRSLVEKRSRSLPNTEGDGYSLILGVTGDSKAKERLFSGRIEKLESQIGGIEKLESHTGGLFLTQGDERSRSPKRSKINIQNLEDPKDKSNGEILRSTTRASALRTQRETGTEFNTKAIFYQNSNIRYGIGDGGAYNNLIVEEFNPSKIDLLDENIPGNHTSVKWKKSEIMDKTR